jgi:hypothetical protein
MPGRIVYLESDDEITSAVTRIRASDSARIAVVLPYGSRVATSRINFRLLSRDALTNDKRLSIVSGDPATRALAASAGLPVFASVSEYESSLAGLEDDESRPGTAVTVVGVVAPAAALGAARPAAVAPPQAMTSGRIVAEEPNGSTRSPAEQDSDGTLGLVVPAVVASTTLGGTPSETIRAPLSRDAAGTYDRLPTDPTARPPGSSARPTTAGASGRGRIRTPWLIGGALLALAVLVGGVGAYLLLPSATIAVTPRPERVGPIPLTVVGDTTATQPDATRSVVPATQITIPVSVDDTFGATGKRVALTKASGTVRFSNLDPTSSNRIVAGSIVRTRSDVAFRTQSTITIPSAELIGLQIVPSAESVKVVAVEGGTDGNVDSDTIKIVPNNENSTFLKVTNPDPTTGGSRQEFPVVTQKDVDGALTALNASLAEAFHEAMVDPSLDTGGATVFPSTGVLGEPTPDTPPETLVGQEVATFPLGLSATGTVIAVDPAPIKAIAETQVRAAVKPGHELVAGSVDANVGNALVNGQSVSFPVTASGQQIAILDPEELKAKVLGKPIEEARAILAAFGQVALTVSPDWTGSVPSFESRVTVTVDQAVPVETPAPSVTPPAATPFEPTPTASATGAP